MLQLCIYAIFFRFSIIFCGKNGQTPLFLYCFGCLHIFCMVLPITQALTAFLCAFWAQYLFLTIPASASKTTFISQCYIGDPAIIPLPKQACY